MKRVIGVIIVGLILSLYFGYFFVTDDQNSSFADTVVFVMGLVGLLVTLASIGIWAALKRILQEDITQKISQAEEASRTEALSRMATKVADAFWKSYEATRNKIFLEQAISAVYDAREILEGRESVKKEELRYNIYNNLAFAYAERGNSADTTIAHSLANHLMDNIGDYPNKEINWTETFAYVLYRLPKKEDDKKKALDIINELLKHPGIADATKLEYRKRYSIPNSKEAAHPNPNKSSS